MAGRELNLFIDQDGGRLLSGFTTNRPAPNYRFTFGDSIPVKARVLTPGSGRLWDDADLTSKTIRLSIGNPGGQPTSGTFTVTYGGDTTAALDYNITAAALEAALDGLASITAAGGVTVTKSSNGLFRITFDSAGARTDFSGDGSALYPSSEINFYEAISGDVSTKEVVLLKLEQQPAAFVELTDTLDPASADVTNVRSGGGGISAVQQYTLNPAPYAGSYTITVGSDETTAISWDATAEEVQDAIVALSGVGAGNAVVTGEFPTYTITFDSSLGGVTTLVVDATGLIVPTGRKGELSTNTTGIAELLNSASSVAATLEVEIYDTGSSTSFTPVQTTCSIAEDISGNSPASQTVLPTYLTTTSTGLVKTVAQTLSTGEKAQVLDNLVVDSTDIADWRNTLLVGGEYKNASFTAIAGYDYIVGATATVSDPGAPSDGDRFTVLVRGGTVTVGGTAYSKAGTIIVRSYLSAAWTNHVYSDNENLGIAWTDASGITHGSIYSNVDGSGSAARGTLGQGAVDLQIARTASTQIASGDYSLLAGSQSTASGEYAIALGEACFATNVNAIAMGTACVASGIGGIAVGNSCTSSGTASHSIGANCSATANYTFAVGRKSKSNHAGAFVLADSQNSDQASSTTDELTLRFQNGYRFLEGAIISPTINGQRNPFTTVTTTTAAIPVTANKIVADTDTAGGDITLTFDAETDGHTVFIVRKGTGGNVIVKDSGGTTIYTLAAALESKNFHCDGTNYYL